MDVGSIYPHTFRGQHVIPNHINEKNNITGFYVDALNEYHGFNAR